MTSTTWLPTFAHEPERKRFVLAIPDVAGEATLKYEDATDGANNHIYNFTRTDVPSWLRDRTTLFLRTACDYVRDRGSKILPTCSIMAQYIANNPEDADLVAR